HSCTIAAVRPNAPLCSRWLFAQATETFLVPPLHERSPLMNWLSVSRCPLRRRTVSGVQTIRLLVAMAVAGCLAGCGTPSQPGPRSESSYRKRADFEEKKDDFKDKEREKDKNRFNTEAYSHIVENPFLAADRNPLSTFATSVDTASYGNVRRFLLQ